MRPTPEQRTAKMIKAFHCLDCKCETWDEYYTLRHDLWRQANPAISGQLCIPCLEARLGRHLTPADFTAAPINTMPLHRTAVLRERLGGVPQGHIDMRPY